MSFTFAQLLITGCHETDDGTHVVLLTVNDKNERQTFWSWALQKEKLLGFEISRNCDDKRALQTFTCCSLRCESTKLGLGRSSEYLIVRGNQMAVHLLIKVACCSLFIVGFDCSPFMLIGVRLYVVVKASFLVSQCVVFFSVDPFNILLSRNILDVSYFCFKNEFNLNLLLIHFPSSTQANFASLFWKYFVQSELWGSIKAQISDSLIGLDFMSSGDNMTNHGLIVGRC